jgi:GTP1/Obg family GTP-binding protein
MVQEKLGLLDNCKSYGCSKLILIYHIFRKYRCEVFSRELLLITPNLKELHEFYSELNSGLNDASTITLSRTFRKL